MSINVGWVSDLAFENHATIDGRWIGPGALSWRDLPLTLMAMTVNSGHGHDGSYVAGRIDTVNRTGKSDMRGGELPEGVVSLRGKGVFDMGGANGSEVARLVENDMLRGISVDLSIQDIALRDPDTGEIIDPKDATDEQIMKFFMGELQLAILKATVVAATVCPTPAFDQARIGLTASAGQSTATITTTFQLVEAAALPSPLAAAAASSPRPPRDWFETSEPPGSMPLTVTEEGRVFGHIASWDTCHTGLAEVCTRPPRSQSGYAYFHTGEIELEDGTPLAVGKLMFAGKHAPLSMSRHAASQHYDDNTHVGAYIRAIDGKHGIWACGVLRAGLSDEDVAEIKANPPSGDWRPVNGSLEMVAALAVPVPGYPVPRAQASIVAAADEVHLTGLLVSAGEVIPHVSVVNALVAAGCMTSDEGFEMKRRFNSRPPSKDVLIAAASDDPIRELVALVE